MDFSDFGFRPKLLANVSELGYQKPTPIQSKAIPEILSGQDVVGLAQTGTGKTAAFALPILDRLLNEVSHSLPRVLVIAPTRELVDQIYGSFRELGRGTSFSGVTLYGGTSIRPQLRALRKGVELLVACPGRLLDHLERGSLNLSKLETVVLDEADQMFDMGFLPAIRRIKGYLPKQRQTLLFTATMPKDVEKLTRELTKNPKTIRTARTGLASTVSHTMYSVSDSQKKPLLLQLVKNLEDGSAIVFTRTKRKAKVIGEFLASSGTPATSLQGNLSQSRRKDAINGFRTGKYKVLVATDIAARGIDISDVTQVVNYDMPDTAEAYTHRTGRTGRAEKLGDATSFATSADRQILRRIQRHLTIKIGELQVPVSLLVHNGNEGKRSNSADKSKSKPRGRRRVPGKSGRVGKRSSYGHSRGRKFGKKSSSDSRRARR